MFRRNSLFRLSYWLPLLALIVTIAAQNLTVTSTSNVVGASVNYTYTITSHNLPTSGVFSFTQWTYKTSGDSNPYSTSSKLYYGTTVLNTVFLGSISFNIAVTGGSPLVLILTSMLNPSSTKPYELTLSLTNSTSTITLKANLTATVLADYTISLMSYATTVGRTSSTVTLSLPCPNYIDPSTKLILLFNQTLITITILNSTSYTLTQSPGVIQATGWTTISRNMVITNATIVNPQAGITFSISGNLSFVSNNITYGIQTFTQVIIIQPIAYTLFTVTPTTPVLQYGTRTSLSIASACSYTQFSPNSSFPVYATVTSTATQISASSLSNCVPTNTSVCKHTNSGNFTLSSFQLGVGSFNTTSLVFISYTYYLGSFYPLCKSTIPISVGLQTASTNISQSDCDSAITSMPNLVSLTLSVAGSQVGDLVVISGLAGVIINSSLWPVFTLNNSLYSHALDSSNFGANNTTSGVLSLSIPLAYNNPNYTRSNSLSSVDVYRSNVRYASAGSINLCPITAGRSILTSSLSATSQLTYKPVNITLSMNMQIFDYKTGDYLEFSFKSNGSENLYFLASNLISLKPSYYINGLALTGLQLNDTSIKLVFPINFTFPTTTSPSLSILFANLSNSAIVGSYWFDAVTYQSTTGGIKQVLTSSPSLSISASPLNYTFSTVYLLKNTSLTVAVSNLYRNLLSKSSIVSSSQLSISLPSVFTCSNAVNRTIIVNWLVGAQTATLVATGTTTTLSINLGTCIVGFFNGTLGLSLTETFSNVSSSSTSISTTNYCGNCYECVSSSFCSSCFNSSLTSASLFYSNQCFSTCPTATFLSGSACVDCHGSCGNCAGSSYLNCSTCATNFAFVTGSNYCLSVCGTGKYIAGGICTTCHINCIACLSSSNCYVCKTNATLIGTTCTFGSCNSPCLTCQGTQDTCTSCSPSMALYLSTCVSQCPTSTYKKTVDGSSTCEIVSESASYVPLTITGLVCMMIIFALRAYSSKKIGNQSRRSRVYSQDEKVQPNYKINFFRTSLVLYAYLELIVAIVLLAKNSSYGVGSQSTLIIALGLILHLLSNITFLVGYFRIVIKARVQNDMNNQVEGQNEPRKHADLRKKIIIALSVIFTYRTYKLLYSNLFFDRRPDNLRETAPVAQPNLEETQAPANPTGLPPLPKSLQNSLPNSQNSSKFKKSARKQNEPREQNIASRKPIRSNSFGDENPWPVLQTAVSTKVPIDEGEPELRKFNHPFVAYLTIVNLILGTGLILVGSALEILKSQFVNMLLWGIDSLLVTVISLGLTAWDVWVFANLTKDEQQSEMSSRERDQVNNTHQNLKNEAEIDIKIEPQIKKKQSPRISPKRSSPTKPKLTQRTGQRPPLSMQGVRSSIKRECAEDSQDKSYNMPVLKVFDDFDEKEVITIKETKSKKFSTKNLKAHRRMQPKRNQSISNGGRYGDVCDDLYINFNQEKNEKDPTAASFLQSRKSASPNRSLQQESLGLEGEFEDQPPNFADISDIQQDRPGMTNLSLEDELASEEKEGKLTGKQ